MSSRQISPDMSEQYAQQPLMSKTHILSWGEPPVPEPGSGQFSSGLCDCTDDCGACCVSCFCPCVQYTLNARRLDGSPLIPTFIVFLAKMPILGSWCFASELRTKMRERSGIEGTYLKDTIHHMCFGPLTLAQEKRHLDYMEKNGYVAYD